MSKPKFKVGDVVIANKKANEGYLITREGWIGKVTYICNDREIKVCDDGIHNWTVDVSCFDLYRPTSDSKIVITTDGKVTTATLYNGREKVKTAKTSCHPKDIFDFNTGAKIAFDNLIKEEPKVKPKELLKNGMFVVEENNRWYVMVDDIFVGEDGGFNTVERYDDDLYWKNVYGESVKNLHIDAIVIARCFDSAKRKYKEGEVVWKRLK